MVTVRGELRLDILHQVMKGWIGGRLGLQDENGRELVGFAQGFCRYLGCGHGKARSWCCWRAPLERSQCPSGSRRSGERGVNGPWRLMRRSGGGSWCSRRVGPLVPVSRASRPATPRACWGSSTRRRPEARCPGRSRRPSSVFARRARALTRLLRALSCSRRVCARELACAPSSFSSSSPTGGSAWRACRTSVAPRQASDGRVI